MNAPRQGLFASLLVVSFALHTLLLVLATTHQLNETRSTQGELMTTQLMTESLSELSPPNTVSLALLVSRYTSNPAVASIRVLDDKSRVLATGGLSKTRDGEVFSRDAVLNEQKLGTVEITLIKPSLGEILRNQWSAIFFSLLVHAFLWVAYRAVARPSRQEYLMRINNESRLKHEIQSLTQALEQEKHNAALVAAQAQPLVQPINPTKTKTAQLDPNVIALNIQFYDPKQLLDSVSTTVALPYFQLCQLFLNKSVELCIEHFKLNSSDIHTIQAFEARGTSITLKSDLPNAVECLAMIATVFQLISEVHYKRYRAEKRFVLQTRCAIATPLESMQLSSVQTAERLMNHLVAKETALYLPNELLKQLSTHYELVNLPNPTNVLTRHTYLLNGMDNEVAELAQQLRTEILKGKQAQAS